MCRSSLLVLTAAFLVGLLGCGGQEPVETERSLDLRRRFQTGSFLPSGLSPGLPEEDREDEPSLAVEARAAGQVLAVPSSGQLVVPVDPFIGEATLALEARVVGDGGASGGSPGESSGGSLAIGYLAAAGQPERLGPETDIGSNWTPVERPWSTTGLELDFLVVEITLNDDQSQVMEIRSPRIHLPGTEDAPVSPPVSQPDGPADRRPDIFIIVLDAARASNFGAYGYERDTSPYIDGFAQESLVFRQAFSECPNTSCSVPNLISGVSFVDAGGPPNWNRLSDDLTSLAEYLVEIGYYTIGLSANPNNSTARNSSQGFDEFHEMWKWEGNRGRHPERRDPHRLSRQAIDALREVDPGQPVFMLLHYVPPHEPYAPTPEFDIFGDPGYDGRVRPGVLFRDVRRGEWTLGPDDIEEMIALYDGNLRMADDAVGEVFAALQTSERWDRSIVLVTSDHGEAFLEHGVQGHNSTLFDEMLHIPFILRLPDGQKPPLVDTDRLTVLTDVVPTILTWVGVEPREEVSGIDLLNDTAFAPPRVIFQRRPGDRRFATRTDKWKGLFNLDRKNPMLFDLSEDPQESQNLIDARPLLHHGFAALLRDQLLAARARNFESSGVELPEEDLRELRSLGYLR